MKKLGILFYLTLLACGWAAVASAAPATFADREREDRIMNYKSPLAGAIGQDSLANEMELDQAAMRFMDPNIHCKDNNGNIFPGCGVNLGNETGTWAGGQKRRDYFSAPANGMRSDLVMATALSNQLMTWLASPVNSIWTTFYYLDSSAAAGLGQSRETADGSMAATSASMQQLNAQIEQDKVAGQAVREKFSGCIAQQLASGGAANGNSAMAYANCLGDRFVSAGNFAAAAPLGATLGQSANWNSNPGAIISVPPAPNQHSVLDEVMMPLIRTGTNYGGQVVPSSEYIALLDDMRALIGDVRYDESISPAGVHSITTERWRDPNGIPVEAQFRAQYKKVWDTLNSVLGKLCNHIDSRRNIDVTAYTPFQWATVNILGFPVPIPTNRNDFWALTDFDPNYPTHDEMIDLGIAGGFQFQGIVGDVLFAEFVKSQEYGSISGNQNPTGQDPASGEGRELSCDEFETGIGRKGEFSRIVVSSAGNFTFSKLKLWRRMMAFTAYRIALGQFLNRFRVMRSVLAGVTGSAFGAAGYQASTMAMELIFETAGVTSGEGLEDAYFKNKEALKRFVAAAMQARSSDLGRSSGTLADMFKDEEGESQYSSANNPMAS
jgi:hypothetical protein